MLFVQLVALPTSLLFWQNIKTMSFVSFQKILASLSQIVTEGFSILEKTDFSLESALMWLFLCPDDRVSLNGCD